jgi:N-acetylmuramoyl-L-alanine amidase
LKFALSFLIDGVEARMKIKNGFLEGVKKITSLGSGSAMTPEFIVFHYTAGSSLSGAVSTLKASGNSYNILIDKDGSIHQARAFNRSSGHAGRSNWKAASGLHNGSSLNSNGIGISLVNVGLHDYFSQGRWWYGYDRTKKKYLSPSVADEDANKKSSIYAPGRQQHWDPYKSEQIEAAREIVAALVKEYPTIREIVGHDDIAIDGKFDPGPDFPLADFRAEFKKTGDLGLKARVKSPDKKLTIRDRPQHMGGQKIDELQQNDVDHIRSVTYAGASSPAVLVRPSGGRALTGWASVDIDGSNKHAGFVSLRLLDANPLDPAYASKL